MSCNGKLLERVTIAKILGVHIDEHLTWVDHVTTPLSSPYAALAVRRKRRNLAQPCSQAVSGVISDVIDCKTVGFFLKISKEIGNAWCKSLMRANRASLTRPYSLRGRRLKGKGKGVLGKGVLVARETRGAREEEGRETSSLARGLAP